MAERGPTIEGERLPFALLQLRLDGTVTWANPAAVALLGRPLDVLVDSHVDRLLPLRGRVCFHGQLLPALRLGGSVQNVTLPVVTGDGRELEAVAYATLDEDADDPSCCLALVATRDAMLADDARLRVTRAADSAPGMLFEHVVRADGSGRFTYVSAGIVTLFGLLPEQVRDGDDALMARVHPDDRADLLATRAAAAERGSAWLHRCRIRPSDDGEWTWCGWRALPRAGAAGEVVWHGLAADVTGQRELELGSAERQAVAARREAEALAGTMLDAQPTLVSYWDPELRLRLANRAFLDSAGARSVEDAVGRTMRDIRGAAFVERNSELIARMTAGEDVRSETTLTDGDGRTRHFWTSATPYRREGSLQGYVVVSTDMSEIVEARRQLEAANDALADAERFIRLVADCIPGRVAYWDRDEVCRFANRSFCEWIDKEHDGVLGASAVDVLGAARYAALAPYVAGVLAGEAQEFEREDVLADGSVHSRLVFFFPDWRDGAVRGFVVLGTDVTHLKAAERELRGVNEQLEEALLNAEAATRAKSAFLANMSHEIRTPMNAIIGLTHLMTRDATDPRLCDRLAKVDGAAQHLLEVINDILDLSKVESGKMTLDDIAFDLDDVLSRSFELVADRAREKGLELILDPGHDELPRRLQGDPTRLMQSLVNLLSNAVKFTAEGWVRLRVELLEDDEARCHLRFEVTDTGEGIAESDQPRLFLAFEQADASTRRRHGGTGLGLALTRRLAAMMGGEIGVASAPGAGSTFWFTARLRRPTEASERRPEPGLRGLRALVVERVPEALAPLAALLRANGSAVDAFTDAASAAAHLAAGGAAHHGYDVLLVDPRCVEHDDGALLVALHAALGPELPPAIALTTGADPRLAVPPASDGWHWRAALAKPITPSLLHDALANALRGHGSLAPRAGGHGDEHERTLRERHAGQRVLLAEDNPVNAEVASELLRAAGLVVETATTGRAAVDLALGGGYDVVLMDMQMPGMDGLDATRAIRAELGPALPIVAMTANAFAEDRASCLAAGMDDHVAKPVEPEELCAVLLRWLPAPPTGPAVDRVDDRAAGREGNGTVTLAERLARVPELDLDAAMQRMGGRERMLEQALRSFVRVYGAGVVDLRRVETGDERAAGREACHSLRGACSTIGAVSLAARLHAFESDLATASATPALREHGAGLQRALDGLLATLREALA